jgi:hypothetical protein
MLKETIIIVSSKISDNDLARYAIHVDEKLTGDKRAKAISKKLITECIDWREDDEADQVSTKDT